MSEWIEKTLGEICDEVKGLIKTGPFGSQLHQSDYTDWGIPVVMPTNIIDDKISTDDIAYISEETAERLSHHKMQPGDIVYGRRGDIGRQALITEIEDGWLCGTGCLRISLGETIILPLFLHYYLMQSDVIDWIYKQAIGATMPNLNTTILRSVPICYPSIKTQRRIAAILSAYDDLIENNTRRIQALEQAAHDLYREWFVEFRFPGHESVELVDSGTDYGMIPHGWEVGVFTDIADVLSGGTPKTTIPEYWDGDIPFFSPKDTGSSFYVLNTEKHITEAGLAKCNSKLYPKDTVFITARGTVGKVRMPAYDMAMNQSCYALVGKVDVPQYFIFLLIYDRVEHLKQQAHGAVFDTIIVDTFRRLEIVVPTLDMIDRFIEYIEPSFEQILNLLKSNNALREARDLLLPRLVSGQVDVSEIEVEMGDQT